MNSKGIFMIFICIIAGFYLKLEWLVLLLVIFLFFVVLGSMTTEKKKAPAPGAPEEVIYPLIYEDVGEPPWLYHPETKLEVNPEWKPAEQWANAAAGMANIFSAAGNLIRGKKKE